MKYSSKKSANNYRIFSVIKAIAFSIFILLTGSRNNAVADENANILMHSFMDICMPNVGKPNAVRQYVSDNDLRPITSAGALKLFVGNGSNGGAWYLPGSRTSHFALSIRGITQACAVWAQQADPDAVQSMLMKLLNGIVRPGIQLKKDYENSTESELGTTKSIMYDIFSPDTKANIEFSLITYGKPGGAYQVSIQVVPTTPH